MLEPIEPNPFVYSQKKSFEPKLPLHSHVKSFLKHWDV